MRQAPISPQVVTAPRQPWWKGARGEWLVVVQVALIALVFFGPRAWPPGAVWPFPFPQAAGVIGIVLMIVGASLLLGGILRLGPGLTPLPYPREDGVLIQTGPYALVRHPMYAGGVILALGYGLLVHGWLTLAYAVLLFAFVDMKSRREEKWLAEKYREYEDYRRHVRKLVPFVY